LRGDALTTEKIAFGARLASFVTTLVAADDMFAWLQISALFTTKAIPCVVAVER
jgi:hypothetical protein